jgi:TPR repeat protein
MKTLTWMFAILSAIYLSPALGNPSLRDTLVAATAGDARAQYIAGMMYLFGQGTRRDIPRAVKWLEQSADAKLPQALVALAGLSDVGLGVPLDIARADQLRQQAALVGNPTARGQIDDDRRMPGQRDFRRASLLTELQQYAKALPYAKRAAQAGSANAQLLLGRAYHFGLGMPVDKSAALALYQQSDARGLADGSRAVAYMYEFGEGIGVDRKKALHYYDRAAPRGSSLARRAAANLRSPDYDQPARFYGGDSAHSSPVQDNRCADNGGHMDGTQCFSAGRVPIDPSNGQHYR